MLFLGLLSIYNQTENIPFKSLSLKMGVDLKKTVKQILATACEGVVWGWGRTTEDLESCSPCCMNTAYWTEVSVKNMSDLEKGGWLKSRSMS